VIGYRRRSEKSRELKSAVAIWGNHYSNLNTLGTQPGYATGPFPFDNSSPFELQANLLEKRDSVLKGFYNDADIIHS